MAIRDVAVDILRYADEGQRVWLLVAPDLGVYGYEYAIGPRSTATVIMDRQVDDPDRADYYQIRAAIAKACLRVWSGVPVPMSEITYVGPTNLRIAQIALQLADAVNGQFGR